MWANKISKRNRVQETALSHHHRHLVSWMMKIAPGYHKTFIWLTLQLLLHQSGEVRVDCPQLFVFLTWAFVIASSSNQWSGVPLEWSSNTLRCRGVLLNSVVANLLPPSNMTSFIGGGAFCCSRYFIKWHVALYFNESAIGYRCCIQE